MPPAFSAIPAFALLVRFGAYLILDGFAGPIVEELYFRGYLLPRLSRCGRKATSTSECGPTACSISLAD
jgi:membrane protease YdiL (CAAX protease family)